MWPHAQVTSCWGEYPTNSSQITLAAPSQCHSYLFLSLLFLGSLTLILPLTPRLRFMQWYSLSSQVRDCLRGRGGGSHFILAVTSELPCCCHLSQLSISWSCMTLWDHDSPIQKQTRREQPVSNNCQSHQNTRSDKQGNYRTLLTMVHTWDTHLLLVFSFFCLSKAAVSHICGP